MTNKRIESRSNIQQGAGKMALQRFGKDLGVIFDEDKTIPGTLANVDGYHKADKKTIIVEVWAHIGPAKAAQKKKVLTDVLKLAYIKSYLNRTGGGREIECYMVFVDDEAAKVLTGETWGGKAAEEFGVDTMKVDLPDQMVSDIKKAQKGQDFYQKD